MNAQIHDGSELAEQRFQLFLGRMMWHISQEQLVTVAELCVCVACPAFRELCNKAKKRTELITTAESSGQNPYLSLDAVSCSVVGGQRSVVCYQDVALGACSLLVALSRAGSLAAPSGIHCFRSST